MGRLTAETQNLMTSHQPTTKQRIVAELEVMRTEVRTLLLFLPTSPPPLPSQSSFNTCRRNS